MRVGPAAAIGALCLSLAACIPPYIIPDPLFRQVDQKVTFARLKREADQLKGATVALGGVVVGAKRVEGGTEIEVIQLPLSAYDEPEGPLARSEGRFLVIDPEGREPAQLQNRGITVVGQVVGMRIEKVEEFEFSYPFLSAKFIHLWGLASGPGPRAPAPYYDQLYPLYPYYPYFYMDLYYDWYSPPGYSHGEGHESSGRGYGGPSGDSPHSSPSSHGGGGRKFN